MRVAASKSVEYRGQLRGRLGARLFGEGQVLRVAGVDFSLVVVEIGHCRMDGRDG